MNTLAIACDDDKLQHDWQSRVTEAEAMKAPCHNIFLLTPTRLFTVRLLTYQRIV